MSEQGHESLTESALRGAVVLACLGFLLVLAGADPLAGLATVLGQPGVGQASKDITVGVVLAATGAALVLVGAGRRGAGVMVAAMGLAWLAAVAARSADGSDVLRGPGLALSPLVASALLGLVVALAAPHRAGRGTVVVAATLIGVAVAVAGLRLATYDPFADPTCVQCGHGAPPLLAATVEQRALIDQAAAVLATVCAAAGLVIEGSRLAGGRRPRGRALAVSAGSIVLALAIVAGQVMRLVDPASPRATDPGPGSIVELAAATGAVLLVLGLVAQVVDALRVRIRLRQLARDAASATELGRLDLRLASSLGDRSVVVGYWHEGEGSWVTASGTPVKDPAADSAQGRVRIERAGRPIATVWHRRDIEPQAIRKELTSSFLLALDTERLQAVGMANLRLLQASRARLVTSQETQRRQVERDLHDGLQQRLLSIVFDLRLARAGAERGGDRPRSRWLEQAEMRTLAIVDEVRKLARGIFPAVLSQAGLAAALSSLADEAPIPMTVSVEPMTRLPQRLEVTVYQVVADALADAVRGGASELSVAVVRVTDEVGVMIDHDGAAGAVRLRLVDRVAAAGGSLVDEVAAELPGRRLRIALPCA